MESGKADNPLNLALSTMPEERGKTQDLNVGYLEQTRQWELIVKYVGNIEELAERLNFSVVPLLNSYAVVTIDETEIPVFLAQKEIIFVEKPNRMFFELQAATAASCLPAKNERMEELSGKGVFVGIVDSGIDYSHPDFRNADGTTRIFRLWDQTIPDGIYTEEQINAALFSENAENRIRLLPSTDRSGHGTNVAGIAAGNGRASGGRYRGVAYESKLLVVKLGNSVGGSFPRTTNLLTAVDYLVREARKADTPIAINLSFGNNYGAHDGGSLLEQYLNSVSNEWKAGIIVGTGNEGAARGHFSGKISQQQEELIEMAVGGGQRSVSLQIWKNYVDRFVVELIAPSGSRVVLARDARSQGLVVRERVGGTKILAYLGEPKPYSVNQEIYIEFVPVEDRIDSGIWRIRLIPEEIVSGEYNLWLPASEALEEGTGFLRPSERTTLTIPSTAAGVISVGAYDTYSDSYASFSGRGFTVGSEASKPDLVAPGVNIYTTAVGGGYTLKSGTSMAAPFVTGAAALLMEQGIVQAKDPYLYGEKLKAYLRRGARKLPGYVQYPNQQLGWGALCVSDSLITSQTVNA